MLFALILLPIVLRTPVFAKGQGCTCRSSWILIRGAGVSWASRTSTRVSNVRVSSSVIAEGSGPSGATPVSAGAIVAAVASIARGPW